jgi:MFS transporter, DHA1 family, staphyloferrin A biosynthesis exporter
MSLEVDFEPKALPLWQRTFSSLRHRSYRLYWFGSCSEHMGQHMETMASAWLMMELTGSPYYLGLLSLSRVVPLVFCGFIGGVVADRVNRRQLLLVCLLTGAAISLGLLALARMGRIAPWHLLVAGALTAVLVAFNHPARDTIVPNLTPKHEWMNAIALETISVRTAIIMAAPISGKVISLFGTTPLFGVRSIGMLLAAWWLIRATIPPTPAGPKRQSVWLNLSKGLRYAVANGVIMCLVLVFALREFQQEMSGVFFPFFADRILHAGPTGYGYLNMAQGIGAMVGLFGVASLGNFRHKGWLIIVAGLLAGLFLMIFSFSHVLLLSLLLLITANIFGTVFENVGRSTLQTIVPDEMRGRVMSLKEVVRGFFGSWVAYGLGLGGEYLGVVPASFILGAFFVACIFSMALLLPSFRKL